MTGGIAVLAREACPLRERMAAGKRDRRERQNVQDDPQRLRPQLEAADQRDAVGDEGDDDDLR